MNRHLKKLVLGSTAASLLLACYPAHAIDPVALGQTPPAAAMAGGSTQGSGKRGIFSDVLGCSADGNKQTIAAVAGGVLGGFLGNRIAGRGSRTLGTLLGGALGAAAGSWIGCKLQKADQEKAERALETTISSGQNQSWSNPESGASGKVEVATAPTLGELRFGTNVEPAAGYRRVGGAFVTTTTANIRSAPTTGGTVLGTLPAGQRVWVPAEVSDAPWMLVSEKGMAQGYIAKSLLRQESSATSPGCRLVKQTVTLPGGQDETETLQACRDGSGQWVMTRV